MRACISVPGKRHRRALVDLRVRERRREPGAGRGVEAPPSQPSPLHPACYGEASHRSFLHPVCFGEASIPRLCVSFAPRERSRPRRSVTYAPRRVRALAFLQLKNFEREIASIEHLFRSESGNHTPSEHLFCSRRPFEPSHEHLLCAGEGSNAPGSLYEEFEGSNARCLD